MSTRVRGSVAYTPPRMLAYTPHANTRQGMLAGGECVECTFQMDSGDRAWESVWLLLRRSGAAWTQKCSVQIMVKVVINENAKSNSEP